MCFSLEFNILVLKISRWIKFLQIPNSSIMENSHYILPLIFSTIFNSSCHIHRWRSSDKNTLIFDKIMCHMQSLFVTDFDSVIYYCLVEICSRPVEAHSFNNCVKWIFQTKTLFLLNGEKYIIFDLIEQAWTLGIG